MSRWYLIALRLAAIVLILGAVLFPAVVTAAVDPFQNACQGQGSSSTVCGSRSTADPLTGPNGVITRITGLLALVAGIVALIFLIWGGIKYITAGGDSSQVSTAKNTIIYALIGLVVAALARPLINFVLSNV